MLFILNVEWDEDINVEHMWEHMKWVWGRKEFGITEGAKLSGKMVKALEKNEN